MVDILLQLPVSSARQTWAFPGRQTVPTYSPPHPFLFNLNRPFFQTWFGLKQNNMHNNETIILKQKILETLSQAGDAGVEAVAPGWSEKKRKLGRKNLGIAHV